MTLAGSTEVVVELKFWAIGFTVASNNLAHGESSLPRRHCTQKAVFTAAATQASSGRVVAKPELRVISILREMGGCSEWRDDLGVKLSAPLRVYLS
jgi:hypothetical protein